MIRLFDQVEILQPHRRNGQKGWVIFVGRTFVVVEKVLPNGIHEWIDDVSIDLVRKI